MTQRMVDQFGGSDDAASEEWSAIVGHRHRGWKIWQARSDSMRRTPAVVRNYHLDNVTVVSCLAAPCEGVRDPDREADHHDGDEVGILVVHQGREQVSAGGGTLQLNLGQALVWDTARAGSFRIDRVVDKSTIFMPRAVIDEWFPVATRAGGWGVVSADRTLMLRSMLRSLDQLPVDTLQELSGVALGSALRELTFLALDDPLAGWGRAGRRMSTAWAQALSFVDSRLGSPVTAELLAAELSMSVRSTYQLFADHGTTVRRFVKERRLVCARDDLSRDRDDETIAAVAHRWGFADQSTFTKAFRARFGAPPGAFSRSRTSVGATRHDSSPARP